MRTSSQGYNDMVASQQSILDKFCTPSCLHHDYLSLSDLKASDASSGRCQNLGLMVPLPYVSLILLSPPLNADPL